MQIGRRVGQPISHQGASLRDQALSPPRSLAGTSPASGPNEAVASGIVQATPLEDGPRVAVSIWNESSNRQYKGNHVAENLFSLRIYCIKPISLFDSLHERRHYMGIGRGLAPAENRE